MSTKKAPTGGQGWKSGVDSFFSNIRAAVVKVFVLLAIIARAGGAR
ncbi:hypothetical protein DesfrDRAFT_0735 [Solidesulfovibrio fructosivorans JJ]]|uniref:Uncharacterized protein n=1 Tax=Solidesulfovibrio fructosivorans JJ] TaxID=596151 RepID=E1JSZ6_SOLFR|nr:hypothetical protein DesfrDRAFT_0735 [Solidesulfovibrio fructosivorans JJ]]